MKVKKTIVQSNVALFPFTRASERGNENKSKKMNSSNIVLEGYIKYKTIMIKIKLFENQSDVIPTLNIVVLPKLYA